MSRIAIVNSSTVVTDTDGAIMTAALNILLPRFCKDWDLPRYTAVYVGKGKQTSILLKVSLLDNAYIDGALGYHYETDNIPYGKCFAQTILDNGGVMLYSSDHSVQTVAQVLSHEVFELLGDHNANTWWDIGDGQTLYAAEACDPVQGNIVTVTITTKQTIPVSVLKNRYNTSTRLTVTKVGMSDWILPVWGDPQDTRGPYNYLRTLNAPFTIDSGGYAIQLNSGSVGHVFGMKFADDVTDAQRRAYSLRNCVCKRSRKMTSAHQCEFHTPEC